MSRTTKKIEKIAKNRDLEDADTSSLVIALSNLEVVAAIEDQTKRLKSVESRLDDINKSVQEMLKTYYEFETAKSRGL
jgi:cell division protein FtsL